ncbi:MAG TPA: hypothetical protein VFG52_10950 [Xanthomonadales bacterium]|nr:hypothetical protein [Xanthomonadales bacterium]
MNPETDLHQPPEKDTVAPAAASIATLAVEWAFTAGQRVKLISELALAEAKLAAISLALMAFLAMLAAAFVLGTWGLLMAGLIYGLLQLQVPLWPLLLVLGGLHALLATLAWRAAVALSNNLEFGHTRGQIDRELHKSKQEPEYEMAAATAQS